MSATPPKIRLGTRSSPLARWQADWVTSQLVELGIEVEQVLITTQGDVRTGSLSQIGGQGLFTKEIQRALLDNRVDLAVHSLKDLPTAPTPGLTLAAIPPRETTHDCLVSNSVKSLQELPKGARLGTGSLRRRAQALFIRPDLVVEEIRGNVDSRLRKLDEGQYDAIMLAEAGLKRLGLDARMTQILPLELMLPAVGQGALGLETREDDIVTQALLMPLDHAPSHAAIDAERSMLATLRGGCLAPIGASATVSAEGELTLIGVVVRVDGEKRISAQAHGPMADAVQIGKAVAEDLLSQGASELIAQSRPAT